MVIPAITVAIADRLSFEFGGSSRNRELTGHVVWPLAFRPRAHVPQQDRREDGRARGDDGARDGRDLQPQRERVASRVEHLDGKRVGQLAGRGDRAPERVASGIRRL
jgi:hypothetical protein